MRVQDIMTRAPITAHPHHTISHALQLMIDGGFHHLPVVSRQGHLIGVVTLRDCRVGLNLPQLPVSDVDWQPPVSSIQLRQVMSRSPIVTTPETSIFDATSLMYSNGISCLPVMLDETLIGIITTSDLLLASM
ncbi:MAG: CBS domain-containing protein, partial [Chloroflexota bacterium]